MVWSELVGGGAYAHRILTAGTVLELTDVDGDACAHVLLYNADLTVERLNIADTVKVQWQVYPTTGSLLLSDQGRVLASLDQDTSGKHDTFYGASTLERNVRRYGDGSPQGASPAGRELFQLAASKYGLGRRDLPPSVSFFQGVRIDAEGHPTFTGSSGPGRRLRLRMEMPVVVLVANAPHPRDPRENYVCTPLRLEAWAVQRTRPGDDLWSATPEGRRAFENTGDYLVGRGLS